MSTTEVVLMRTTVLLLVLVALLTGCAGGGDTDSTARADTVERTTTERAEETIPLAVEALVATEVEVYTQWESCMAISSKYSAFGQLTAAEKDVPAQLGRVREALLGAGYADVTQVEGHVSMERDGMTFDLQQPGAAYGPHQWQVSVFSECASYRGDDKDGIDNDTAQLLEGLAP